MKEQPTLRATLYLIFSLLGMLVGGFFPTPISSLCHLFLVILALATEKWLFEGEALPQLSVSSLWRRARLWLLFPAFLLATVSVNILSGKMTVALGGTLPDLAPTPMLFIGAVLIAPIAEELLFRGLLMRLFRRFGDVWALLLTATLFALAHGDLFQMPYALVAGLFLGAFALASGGVLFPIIVHFLYNLLAFFGDDIPTAPLLWSLLGLTLFSRLLLFLGERPHLSKRGRKPKGRELFPLLVYAAAMVTLAILNF